ncbi:MAG: hypothetical protein ACXAC7_22500, partial [Candidatus Hodarchaeales archaeon]
MKLLKRKIITNHLIILNFLLIMVLLTNNGSFNVLSIKISSKTIDWNNNIGYFDRIVFNVITSDELMVQSIRDDEIDMVGQFVDVSLITQSDLDNPNIEISETRRRGFGHITFNTDRFPTNIRALRQGMA